MSEKKPRSIVVTAACWIGGIAVAIVLYVASIGPVFRMTRTDVGWPEWTHTLYAPLIFIAKRNAPFDDCLEAYIVWSCGLARGDEP
jgi:hypothetical protein